MTSNAVNTDFFKVNNKNTRKRCEMYSKLTIKTPKRDHRRRFGVFIVKSEHISGHFLVLLMLTLNKYMLARKLLIIDLIFTHCIPD